MFNNKVKSMIKAKKFEFDYWDGHRNHGYGGYKYIPEKMDSSSKKINKTIQT